MRLRLPGLLVHAWLVFKAGATARGTMVRHDKGQTKDVLGHSGPSGSGLGRIDCEMDAHSSALLLLTSTGLGSFGKDNISIEPSEELIQAFRDLILRLPDTAWPQEGALKKAAAAKRAPEQLKNGTFAEPELYGGLDVVILEDDCFLKETFWNQASPFFNLSSGISLNYLTAGLKTDVKLVQPYFGQGLDQGWCIDFASNKAGFLGGLGFEPSRIRHVSLWDQLAADSAKVDVFKLQTTGHLNISDPKRPDAKAAAPLTHLLGEADVVIVNGGNPDFGKYVFTAFAADVMNIVTSRVVGGSLVFVGQSAGSMVGAADVGLTYEPNPGLLKHLLHGRTAGLGFAGKCAVRPHDSGQLWDIAAAVYGKMRNLTVVRVADGQGLQCLGTSCSLVGAPVQAPPSVFSGTAGRLELERLADVFGLFGPPGAAKSFAWRSQAVFVRVAAMAISLMLAA